MLKTNRGFFKILLLSIVTLGIYPLFVTYNMAKEANLVDEGGKKIGGLLAVIFLTPLTLGIYGFYWNYKICEKYGNSVRLSGGTPRITGKQWLLWTIFGSLIVVGPLVAYVKQIHLWNDSNAAYNSRLTAKAQG